MIKRRVLYFIMAILGIGLIAAWSCKSVNYVKVITYVKPAAAYIGDPLDYVITVVVNKDTELRAPDISKVLEGFDIKDEKRAETVFFSRKTCRFAYRLKQYYPGEYVFGGFEIFFRPSGQGVWRSREVPPARLYVRKLVKDSDLRIQQFINVEMKVAEKIDASVEMDDQSLAEKKKVELPIRYNIKESVKTKEILTIGEILFKFAAYAVLGILSLGVIVLVAVFFIKVALFEIPPDPHDVAVKRLKALAHKKLIVKGDTKGFFSELSDILMGYVRARYQLEDLQMTSEDFISRLSGIKELTTKQRTFLISRISVANIAKYSAQSIETEGFSDDLKDEIAFVEATKPKVV